ncbi:MAG: hypothetical protein ABJQ90_16325 [Parasphingorhabdus sp.]
MTSPVGAASPGRRKLLKEFEKSSVLSSVIGALSVLGVLSGLLGGGMINAYHCLAVVAMCV